MQEIIVNFVSKATELLWGPFMLTVLVGGGLFISYKTGFVQIKYFGYMCSQTFGTFFKRKTNKSDNIEGTLSPLQAVTTALASTVGAANIVGVPVAIMFGGPGAVFWMWLTAIVGMATKYGEVILGVTYREKNKLGEFVGGPMYYLKNGLKSKFLGNAFAFIFMLAIVSGIMVQSNSAAGSVAILGINENISAIIMVLVVGIVVIGGVKRIGKVAENIVPIMASLYVICALVIVIANFSRIPNVIVMIFRDAFTPKSATGGFLGSTVAMALRWGVARGAYSNEAGMGSAPIAHATAKTDHPVRQGLWGMFEVFVDTIVICTVTALVVLTTDIWTQVGIEPSSMVAVAFSNFYGKIGGGIVSLSVLLFVISTIIVILFYGEKLAEYLFGHKFSIFMRCLYLCAIFLGARGQLKFVWNFIDLLFGLAVIPNMIGIIALSGIIASKTKEYFNSEEYYLKDIKKSKKAI